MDIARTIEIMRFYSNITKLTTILLSNNRSLLSIIGIPYTNLVEYFELKELLNIVPDFEIEESAFYTYKTNHDYIYNVTFLPSPKNEPLILISGPLLNRLPTTSQVKEINIHHDVVTKKKNTILRMLYCLPKYSDKHIKEIGKLLYIMLHTSVTDFDRICQITDVSIPEMEFTELVPNENNSNNEFQNLFEFILRVGEDIMYGQQDNISHTINENIFLLEDLITKYDNFHSLKNFCVILCTMSYCYSLDSNSSFEILFKKLWSFVTQLDRTHSFTEVLHLTSFSLKDFSQTAHSANRDFSPHVNQVLKYINSNYTEKITLDDLAKEFHITPVYISYIIKKETNLSLSDHINLTRIRQSKIMLAHTNKSISEIAFMVGYNYQSHFTKVFKKYEGITPKEYRSNNFP